MYYAVLNDSDFVPMVDGEEVHRSLELVAGNIIPLERINSRWFKKASNGVRVHKNWISKVVELVDDEYYILDSVLYSHRTERCLISEDVSCRRHALDGDIRLTTHSLEAIERFARNSRLNSRATKCQCGKYHPRTEYRFACSCGNIPHRKISEIFDFIDANGDYSFAGSGQRILRFSEETYIIDNELIETNTVSLCSECNVAFFNVSREDLEYEDEYGDYVVDSSVMARVLSNPDIVYHDDDFDVPFNRCKIHSRPSSAPCSVCGTSVNIEDAMSDNGSYMCHSCYRDVQRFKIRNYSYVPDPLIFYKATTESDIQDSDLVFRGVEMEVEVHNENRGKQTTAKMFARAVNEILPNFIYMKSDASIDGGFEIVTHPFTDAWRLENADKLQQMFDLMEEYDLRAGNEHGVISCGMHVHVSTGPIDPSILFKVSSFIYGNRSEVLLMADRFNRRRVSRYCYFPDNLTDTDFREMGSAKRNNGKIEHHAALQYTPRTLEFRIFDGTATMHRFTKNMEFIAAVFEYANSVDTMTFAGFLEFISMSSYDELISDVSYKQRDLRKKGY